MTHWENIWSCETPQFRVAYDVAPDDDLDLSWDDDGSTREGLESGKYVAFIARVQVTHKDTGAELGADYLGGCIYESPEAFIDHRGIKAHPGVGSYFSDMVRSAVAQARVNLAKIGNIKVRVH
jgi:hypothetical protein